ncbi:MAG TPA: hypothetical protein VF624_03895 [Tepidisphaeraceae bacterium]|jgi:ElaB/YqjD/DUF883 family membrane-anchored ribosome-binding protein
MSNQDTANQNASDAAAAAGDVKNDATRAARSAVEAGKAQYEVAREKLGQGVEQARTYATDVAGQAREKLTEGVESARGYAQDAAYAARDKASDTLDNLESQIRQNPIAALAIAAGVGVVVGIWIRGR